jgi:hypothetical protein
MRRIILCSLLAGFTLCLAAQPTLPQAQRPSTGAQASPKPASPAADRTPYRPVAVTIPTVARDPTFETFRKELAGIAQRKDRSGLAGRVVGSDFFWERDFGGGFDPAKPGIDNLVAALGLDSDDGSGWEALAAFAAEPTAAPLPGRATVICTPAVPRYDESALEKLVEESQTDGLDWMYPRSAGVPVRATPQPRAAVIDTLGLALVRTLGFEGGDTNADPIRAAWVRVVTPSGKVGFVAPNTLLSPYTDRLCFAKDSGGAWKIAGYVGGGD